MERTQTGHHGADTWWTYLQYFYRGKTRVCKTSIVRLKDWQYHFYFKKRTPGLLIKTDGVWYYGIYPLTESIELYDLWVAITEAIDAGTFGDNYTPENPV